MEVEELEIYLSCPTDVEGIIDALAWKVCDHEERRRFVAIRTGEGTLVADVRQYAMLRRKQDAEYEELHVIIECMNETQKGFLATSDKQKLMSGAPEKNREKFCQEIKDLDDRISAEEVELLDKKKEMRELVQERRRTKVEGWRDTDAAEGEVAQKAAFRSQNSEAEVGYSNVPEAEVSWHGGRPEFCWQFISAPQKKRVVAQNESGETQDYVSAPPFLKHRDQSLEEEDDVTLEELGFIASAVREPRRAEHMCDKNCR